MRKVFVAPSLLAADFSNLGDAISRVEKLGAAYLHYDVMDGHFVANLSMGVPVVKSLASRHRMINDVHLMIAHPSQFIADFAKAGANILTFHYEACRDDAEIRSIIASIKSFGVKVGMSVKPLTDVSVLFPYVKDLDLALVMSVEPGFGGQMFLKDALNKIAALKKKIAEQKLSTLIEVDGGINDVTASLCIKAGADILVAGSYLFGHSDLEARYAALLRV